MIKLTPRQVAIQDMRSEGLDTTVLRLRKTIIIEEEEIVYVNDDGRILNGGKRVKHTTIQEIIK